jgi:hypothetical protein
MLDVKTAQQIVPWYHSSSITPSQLVGDQNKMQSLQR